MVPGFNHNIKHNGHIYHIQTEDSGVQNPHIITHLFVGGNILATKKTSYADIVNAENLLAIVKELMQEQHKAMLRNLINGVYDNISPAQNGQAAAAAAAARLPEARKPAVPAARPGAARPQELPAGAKKPAPAPAPVRPAAVRAPEPIILKKAPPQKFPSVHIPGAAPPKPEPIPVTATPAKISVRVKPQTAEELPPEVLAARRLAEKPKPKDTSGPTIFGESLISEKSLDEVILGYLAGNEEDG